MNIHPSTVLGLEDAMPMQILYFLLWADSHPNSLGVRGDGNLFQLHPNSMSAARNSMLLWADAQVIFALC